VTAIYGQCNAYGVQQQLKFALTKILATVKTDWSLQPHCGYPMITLVPDTDCIRHMPGNCSSTSLTTLGTSTRSVQLRCHGNFHALDGNRWLPHRCLVVKICKIMVLSLVR